MARPVSVSRFRRCRLGSHFGCVLIAEFAIFLQRLVDDAFQFGWHIGIQPHRWNVGARPEWR